jgi:hypothetical protein
MNFSELIDFYHKQTAGDKEYLAETFNKLKLKLLGPNISREEEDILADECYRLFLNPEVALSDEEYNDVMSANTIWDKINGNIQR